MPVVVVKTAIPIEEYARFKQKAEQLGVSEYGLAQEAILLFVNEPQNAERKMLMKKLMDFFKKDIELTGQL